VLLLFLGQLEAEIILLRRGKMCLFYFFLQVCAKNRDAAGKSSAGEKVVVLLPVEISDQRGQGEGAEAEGRKGGQEGEGEQEKRGEGGQAEGGEGEKGQEGRKKGLIKSTRTLTKIISILRPLS